MKKVISSLMLFVFSSASFAASFEIDKSHTSIDFKVAHMVISKVRGRFDEFQGTFEFDEKTNTLSNLKIKVAAKSLSTKDEKRDKHLRSADFFDVAKFTDIVFEIPTAKLKQGGSVEASGFLTMKGKKLPVSGEIELSGLGKAYGAQVLALELEGDIKRKDWGMTWNDTLDSGNLLVGDKVEIEVVLQAKKLAK